MREIEERDLLALCEYVEQQTEETIRAWEFGWYAGKFG